MARGVGTHKGSLAIYGFGASQHTNREATPASHEVGGVRLFINELWCKTVLLRGTLCNKDVELLSVFMCPSHFPWELPQISVIVVYIHLKVNQTYALELILQTVS